MSHENCSKIKSQGPLTAIEMVTLDSQEEKEKSGDVIIEPQSSDFDTEDHCSDPVSYQQHCFL